ncbi:dimethylaniline monooxygenase [N-oxide-forming] 4 isoform X2 [Fukomys damarensis]|uniref:dimethylaniline monooxygenase [N-oxide-forming] 4 isoform X2 n=1 Tax=Fukomys damarensis TaxID=885580 RepID=UPI0014551BFA|nr:dimethylaniline monooxygenase [N-oxide-forming] 4 isoform X2 [Fukomys damarensis]
MRTWSPPALREVTTLGDYGSLLCVPSLHLSPSIEDSKDGMTRVYRSLVTNVCKEMSCYSDFPFQEDYPNFMSHGKFWDYLQAFAKHFDLLKYISFKTTVCSVTKCPDFSENGQWDVVTETEGKQNRAVFDAVMVCTGHFLNPHLPLESFPGVHNFQGQILHSQEYRTPEAFQGKRVLVIGLGNTGGDIAVELSRTAAQVFLSTRTGTWVYSRSSVGGYPRNMMSTRRCNNLIAQVVPSCFLNWIQERQMNKRFNHENYGLSITKGKKKKAIVNDELPTCILCGTITVKTSVKEFTETSAVFEDGTVETNMDTVIFATGYTFSFPFLEEPLKSLCSKKMFLYKRVFPQNLEKTTFAVIGLISLTGSILAATELQARWATRVFKGLCKIPPTQKLMAEVIRKQQLIKRPLANTVSYYLPNKSRIQTLLMTPLLSPETGLFRILSVSHFPLCPLAQPQGQAAPCRSLFEDLQLHRVLSQKPSPASTIHRGTKPLCAHITLLACCSPLTHTASGAPASLLFLTQAKHHP